MYISIQYRNHGYQGYHGLFDKIENRYFKNRFYKFSNMIQPNIYINNAQ